MTGLLPRPLADDVILPIGFDDDRLDTPAVLVDLDVVDSNIHRMSEFARRAGFSLRPHIKTHKSLAMARRQLAAGASGLAVATTAEAVVMARSGVTDLLLAYPTIERRKLERVAPLAKAGLITFVSDSAEATHGYRELAGHLDRTIPVLVEVDTGMDRVGVEPSHVLKAAQEIATSPGLQFRGVMTHAGHAHNATGARGIELVARHEASVMGMVREDLETAGLDFDVVSAGSTITAPYLSAADGITEIRPGTYIYNDLRTLSCYACTADAIAMTALATVVSRNGDRITLNTGSKTLTPTTHPDFGYGHLLRSPDAQITRMSEEHAMVQMPEDKPPLSIGDRVQILPVHACVWSDLQPEIYGVRMGRIEERITVDAMRHSL
ncbi:MAG TPA: alanine racemase [Mycobacterium sp.]|nr:alanine racemase [Mycobacterium sp.]